MAESGHLPLRPRICYAPDMADNSHAADLYPFWLSGQRCRGPAREVRNAYNRTVVGRVCQAEIANIETAMADMAACAARLAKQTAAERKRAIGVVLDGLKAQREQFARTITWESGKPIRAARGEVDRAITTFRLAMEACDQRNVQDLEVQSQVGFADYTCRVIRVPIGPCLFITPFNFPLNLVAHKVAPALACGCPFILKPSDRTPLTALLLGELLAAAKLPAGAWHVLPAAVDHIAIMAAHPVIRLISFTGSEKVGWDLYRQSAGKTVLLELGSNSPVVVEPDADMPEAAKRIVRGAFGFCGQSCISVQRIYIHRGIVADFTQRLLAETGNLQSGDPMNDSTDMGPMIDLAAAQRVEEWVREAVAAGGRLLCGGQRDGAFYAPTLLTHVPGDQRIVRQEVFGPVAVIQAYDTFAQAMDLCNDPRLGIHAGVFTHNIESINRAAEQLDFANVVINDVPTNRAEAMPYGGVKFSGLGREGVRNAMEHLTLPKALLMRNAT